MLEAHGLTSVVAPGDRALYRIVKIQGAATHTEPRDTPPFPEPGFMILDYPIEHIPAPDLAN